MPDYKNMSATEAMRAAREASGLTVEELGAKCGIRAASLRRYFEQQEGYLPGLDKLPSLIMAFGNRIIPQWLEAQLEGERPNVAPARNRAEALTAIARIGASVGDCQRILADSEKSGIDPALAREARGKLNEVITQCRLAKAMLYEQASHRMGANPPPLASLGKTEKRPWWKRFLLHGSGGKR